MKFWLNVLSFGLLFRRWFCWWCGANMVDGRCGRLACISHEL